MNVRCVTRKKKSLVAIAVGLAMMKSKPSEPTRVAELRRVRREALEELLHFLERRSGSVSGWQIWPRRQHAIQIVFVKRKKRDQPVVVEEETKSRFFPQIHA